MANEGMKRCSTFSALRATQIKPPWDTPPAHWGGPHRKAWSVGKDVEKLEASYPAGGNVNGNGTATVGKSWTQPQTAKQRYHVTSDSTLGSVLKRNKNICPHKNLSMNVLSSFLHHRQKVETAQMFISRRMDSWNAAYPYNGALTGNKKKWSIDGTTWMKLNNIPLNEGS